MNAYKPNPHRAEGPHPLVREMPSGLPYPVEALGALRKAVDAVQGMTLAPIALPAQSALTVASLAVQGHADVETLGGKRPTSLFALTIAQSGERKSACYAPLIAELREFEKEQAEAYQDEMTRWNNEQSIWKGERDRILADAKKGKGEKRVAARADLDALGSEPPAPASPERVVTEPTFEGLTRLFAEGQPSLGIFSDEAGQFLGGHAMNSDNRQKTLAALNDLWQGNPIRRTRKGDGSLTLYGRRLAAHLMVQPGVARTFMADPMAADTGFLARFLVCEPPSTIGTRLHAHSRRDDRALAEFSTNLRRILMAPLPMDATTRELQPRVLPLSSRARALLVQFADLVEQAQAPGGEFSHAGGTASKTAEQAARIAGVLTLWHDLHAPEVTGETMADGIELAQFYLGEAVRLADAATVSAEIDMAERLRLWLLGDWPEPEVLPGDILQRAPVRALRERPAAKRAITTLVEAGWLVPLEPGTDVRGTARKEAYRIVRPSHVV
ncbi:YfjI family protein [Tropicimonas aquimaris]|uniref:YfjI family protein n=1 Tax=Tropicimonas aquimaris TaxID=914152 RepID=A0ABW3IZE5_9RHOB